VDIITVESVDLKSGEDLSASAANPAT